MGVWDRILQPNIMPFVVAIVAIAGGISIKIVNILIKHHERIAMIQHGIHPDYPPENDEVQRNDANLR
jgi:hypothetical protein